MKIWYVLSMSIFVISILGVVVSSFAVDKGEKKTIDLLTLIPKEKHEKCGLTKLTSKEIKNLSEEFVNIFLKVFLVLNDINQENKNINGVAVIAPSISTSIVARTILNKMGVVEVSPKRADLVLTVVRSSLFDPLSFSYDCYHELKTSAELQLNIIGPKCHIYLYQINEDLTLSKISHSYFEYEDF